MPTLPFEFKQAHLFAKSITHFITATLFLNLALSSVLLAQADDIHSGKHQSIKAMNLNVHWLNPDTLVWSTAYSDQQLQSLDLQLVLQPKPLQRSEQILGVSLAGRVQPDSEIGRKYPYLQGQVLLKFADKKVNKQELSHFIKRPVLLQVAHRPAERNGSLLPPVIEHFGLQQAELLDHSFAYDGQLGLRFEQNKPGFRLWAPTAQSVRFLRFDSHLDLIESLPMTASEQGTWELTGNADWQGLYYQYEVQVYSPQIGKMVTNRVSDPYSLSLAANSTHSQIIDLNAPELMPSKWKTLHPPQKTAPEDMVIYELHLRDFSVSDKSIPVGDRGKYSAFNHTDSLGMQHLKGLAQAGLTHLHFLPIFDFASVPEVPQQQTNLDILTTDPDSSFQQSLIGLFRAQDAFNWGYDPYHYGVPEGSYSRQAQGSQRILEFRQMVQNLANIKLGVIMDVVYNHGHSAGQDPKSVFDKIVPGYYYRLDSSGQIQQSTCCPDTASEHVMMQKIMVDTLVRWARDYKITGFRFDLMGHHTRQNLQAVREALDKLTLPKDGIDGKSIYLYGEGWKFGSLDTKASQQAMHQQNAGGTGIGTFNDRLRDSARGGNFDHGTRSDQGWLSGLYHLPNHSRWNTDTPQEPEQQARQLGHYTDLICLGMSGGLKEYRLPQADGSESAGKDMLYRGGAGAGYTLDPQESVNYVSAHDNYSLWDQIAAKAPFIDRDADSKSGLQTASVQTRLEMQMLGIATVLLGQGVPFLDSGIEILRSKSGDGDSYDSGDWFNVLDWTYQDNGWGKGLPAAWRNQKEWDFWRPRLIRSEFKPEQEHILAALAQTRRLMQIRQGSSLLRLQNAQVIQNSVRFLQLEAKAPVGVILMHVADTQNLDPDRKGLLVILNPLPKPVHVKHSVLTQNWRAFSIHDKQILQSSHVVWVNSLRQDVPAMAASQFALNQDQLQIPARGIVVLEQAQSNSVTRIP